MSESSNWQDANNRYLAERLAWLRGRLQEAARLSRPHPALAAPQPREPEAGKSFWRTLLGKDSSQSPTRTQLILPARASVANLEETEPHSVSKTPRDAPLDPPALT